MSTGGDWDDDDGDSTVVRELDRANWMMDSDSTCSTALLWRGSSTRVFSLPTAPVMPSQIQPIRRPTYTESSERAAYSPPPAVLSCPVAVVAVAPVAPIAQPEKSTRLEPELVVLTKSRFG